MARRKPGFVFGASAEEIFENACEALDTAEKIINGLSEIEETGIWNAEERRKYYAKKEMEERKKSN